MVGKIVNYRTMIESPNFEKCFFRHIMYPDGKEDALMELTHATTHEQVLHFLERSGPAIKPETAAQAVAAIYQLQKYDQIQSPAELSGALKNSPDYAQTINILAKGLLDLPMLAYTFLCLRRLMTPPLYHEDMQKIQIRLARATPHMDLTTLTWYAMALQGNFVKESFSFRWGLALAPAIQRLSNFIEEAKSAEDFLQVAICINSVRDVISHPLTEKFARRVLQALDQGVFHQKDSTKSNNSPDTGLDAICRIISLAVLKRNWIFKSNTIMHRMLMALRGRCHLMRPLQALVVSRVSLYEPVTVTYEIQERVYQLYNAETWKTHPHVSQMDFIRSLAMVKSYLFQDEKLLAILKGALRDEDSWQWDFNNVFDTIRSTVCLTITYVKGKQLKLYRQTGKRGKGKSTKTIFSSRHQIDWFLPCDIALCRTMDGIC